MSDLQEKLAAILRQAAGRLRGVALPVELAERMEELAQQVYQPCVVAVVGRVKVGKSTFVNALLGQDLAKVGTAEERGVRGPKVSALALRMILSY